MSTKKKPVTKTQIAATAETKAVVEKVAKLKGPDVLRNMTELQVELGAGLAALSAPLTETLRQFEEAKLAVEVMRAELEMLHDIKAEAITIEEIQARRLELEAAEIEDKAELEKARRREETDFTYSRDLGRRKEADEYLQKRAIRDRDLQEREAAVKSFTEELVTLRAQVAGFPQQLTDAVGKAVQGERTALTKEHTQALALLGAEHDGERKLASQRIANLELGDARYQAEIDRLNAALQTAIGEVGKLAAKTVDATGAQQALSIMQERDRRDSQNGSKIGAR
jgi:hypothetical protein